MIRLTTFIEARLEHRFELVLSECALRTIGGGIAAIAGRVGTAACAVGIRGKPCLDAGELPRGRIIAADTSLIVE